MIGEKNFATLIRKRRRQLGLRQEDVARKISVSLPYIGHLESRRRHPSEKVIIKLARVLQLDARELFLLANPQTEALVSREPKTGEGNAWDVFSKDQRLRRLYNVTDREMETLSRIATLGEVRRPRDFIFILNAIRHALGR